jgi:predicted alpha-1,2-mannosidase
MDAAYWPDRTTTLSWAMWEAAVRVREGRMASAVLAMTLVAGTLVTGVVPGSPARAADPSAPLVDDPAAYVDTTIGTANAGNTFPGAVRPFGMFSFSPEGSNDRATRTPAPGGYQYAMKKIRGFSLTHLSGTGCAGASGDIPFYPHAGAVTTSPSADSTDAVYASAFAHADETATAGYYRTRLASGVDTELTSTLRTGSGRFTYPEGSDASMLFRTSDSELGSTDATVTVDPATRTVSGSVTSGNFCGYIGGTSGGNGGVNRRAYYTLYFTATFDTAFTATGSWVDGTLTPGGTSASGGTTFGADGYRPAGKGSGAYVTFDTSAGRTVGAKVGISYVSAKNAAANLAAENPPAATFEAVRAASTAAWNTSLGRIRIGGGTDAQRTTFYTALYHALLHPNVYSDVNGQYRGFGDTVATQQVKRVRPGQSAQYANYSGWDVYRSQLQLLGWLEPEIGNDVATSLLNQAQQNGGVWDRWTHNSGGTHVMVGDPAPVSLAGLYAFGATEFPAAEALTSLVKAARTPTALDAEKDGWNIAVVGQRPSLDKVLKHGYYPTGCNAWACANETLEMAGADFGIASLAGRLGRTAIRNEFTKRSQTWQNQFNPAATATGGYFQERSATGTWSSGFNPASSAGFVEGTAAHYVWLVQHNPAGLFDAMGGRTAAADRLDKHFRAPDGSWRLVGSWDNNTYANMDNEPSIHVPYLYNYAGAPYKAQETVRQTVDTLWKTGPGGIPGNDDLGTMSAWYVFSALGGFPQNPSRAELVLGSPLFPTATVTPNGGKAVIFSAPATSATAKYIHGVTINGRASTRTFLPESLIRDGGTVAFTMADTPDKTWGTGTADVPPSFRDGEKGYQTAVSPGTVTVAPAGPAAVLTLRADRLNATATPVKVTVDAPTGLVVNPRTATMTVDPESGSGTAQLTVTASKSTPLSYLNLPVTFSTGGKVLSRHEVLVIVAPAGSLIGHFSNTGIGDDGLDNADFDSGGWYYSRQNLAAKGVTAGVRTPVPGTDLAFTLPEIPAGRPDNLIAAGQKLDMAALAAGTTKLSFIGSSGGGDAVGGSATITYTDGSTQQTPLEFGDWCLGGDVTATPKFGNIGILQSDYRNRDAARDTAKPWLFATAPVELQAGKKVATVTLPSRANLHVFAIAENGTPAGALPVTAPEVRSAGKRLGRAPVDTRSAG